MFKNVVITGANSMYYDTLLTLISSIHKTSFDIVDGILVYDFGLTEDQIKNLGKLEKVIMVDLTSFVDSNKSLCDSFSSVKTKCHFFKMYTLFDASKKSEKVLWLDAGAMCLKPLDFIFDTIEKEDVFLVIDEHVNGNFTHNKCREIMSATEHELSSHQLWSGLVGFKSNGKYQKIIDEGWEFSLVEGCIDGFDQNHRHDQSVLSILAARHNCPTNDIELFGYWTNHERNLQKALELGSYIFAHRRGHSDHSSLIYKNVTD